MLGREGEDKKKQKNHQFSYTNPFRATSFLRRDFKTTKPDVATNLIYDLSMEKL